ncbi:MAG: hypothetical protein EXQ53_00265 [Acidobacteria bacterium]|nr:hypothetical protein [Acidobacteriota bacterium]
MKVGAGGAGAGVGVGPGAGDGVGVGSGAALGAVGDDTGLPPHASVSAASVTAIAPRSIIRQHLRRFCVPPALSQCRGT